jgi:uroporphyrinogen-III synthase
MVRGSWVVEKKLAGRRIIILREEEQGLRWAEAFQNLGAEVILAPLLKFEPNPSELAKISSSFLIPFTQIIFTSSNGVRFFLGALGDPKALAKKKISAVGHQTAEALRKQGVLVDCVPPAFHGEALLEEMNEDLCKEKILLPIAQKANNRLPEQLALRGADIQVLKIYKTERNPSFSLSLKPGDWVVFTSPSMVEYFFAESHREEIIPFAIGPVTKKAVSRFLKGEVNVASNATLEALLQIMINFSERQFV